MKEKLSAIIGLQFGDEGKGKLVDILAGKHHFVARFGGGANAGHTIETNGQKFVFHQLPSGVLHPQTKNVIGNGCVVHLPTLIEEIEELEKAGISLRDRLLISGRATLLFDFHKELDGLKEQKLGKRAVGTTKRGIGPAYSDRASRSALRVAELLDFEDFARRLRERLTEINQSYDFGFQFDIEKELTRYADYSSRIEGLIADTGDLLQTALSAGKSVLAEGAQGSLLDIDHGTYPFVTSSTTTAGGIFAGLGIPPRPPAALIGVVKAYATRVGSGPFVTELTDTAGEQLRDTGHEYGATTGRPRRTGWLDLCAVRYAARLNGVTAINLTKLDVLNEFEEIKICTAYEIEGERIKTMPMTVKELKKVQPVYETLPGWLSDTSSARQIKDLPKNARDYLKFIEKFLEVPIKWVGVGTDREAMAT